MEYRHELKFLVTDMQLMVLESRLRPLMRQDMHQNGQAYRIRSLYFDDWNDSCMKENEAGVDHRKKYRIRIYNEDPSVIKLEKKIKYRGMTRKEGLIISEEDCRRYMEGKVSVLSESSTSLEKEWYSQIKGSGMHPVCIVSYERQAFVERIGNVRITFDRNISSCEKCDAFFDKNISSTPLLPVGWHILEVKYDELLPSYLAELLSLGELQKATFSKYCYARNYGKRRG